MALNFPDPNSSTTYEHTSSDGNTVTYNWNGTAWVMADTRGASSLDELSDVDTTGVENGNALIYNDLLGAWIPGEGGGGGGVGVLPPAVPGAIITVATTQVQTDNGYVYFSLDDGATFLPSLTNVGPAEVIICGWRSGLFDNSPQGEVLEDVIKMHDAASGDQNKSYKHIVDKVPVDPLTFASKANVMLGAYIEADEVYTVEGVNSPPRVWCTTDPGSDAQVSINGGAWQLCPTDKDNGILITDFESTIAFRHKTINTPLGVTDTDFYIGWDEANSVDAEFVTTNMDSGISTPEFYTPTDGETDVPLNIVFTTSPYSAFGGAGDHATTDWEIALDSDFTNIIEANLDDSNFLTTWKPTNNLPRFVDVYVRVRYRDADIGIYSDWKELQFKTADELPPLGNGSLILKSNQLSANNFEFVVPAEIFNLRIEMFGGWMRTYGNGGGRSGNPLWLGFTINVNPGEVFDLALCTSDGKADFRGGSAPIIGFDTGTLTQANLLAVAGAPGGGSRNQSGTYGGNAGWVEGTDGNGSGNGKKGTQTAGGNKGGSCPAYDQPTNGGPLKGGNAGSGDECHGLHSGGGGAGWYGGGGGACCQGGTYEHTGGYGGAGGGGSSKVKDPGNRNLRDLQYGVYGDGNPNQLDWLAGFDSNDGNHNHYKFIW